MPLFNLFPVSTQVVTIGAAALKTLIATPVDLILAPGVGRVINPISIHWQYLFSVGAFTVPTGYVMSIRYSGATSYIQRVSAVGFLDQASSQTISMTADKSQQAQTASENTKVDIKGGFGTASELTVGSGSLILTIHYSIVNLS